MVTKRVPTWDRPGHAWGAAGQVDGLCPNACRAGFIVPAAALYLAALIVFAAGVAAADDTVDHARRHSRTTDRITLRFKDNVTESAIRDTLREQGLTFVRHLPCSHQVVVRAGTKTDVSKALDRLQASPLVIRADPDNVIRARRKSLPTDPYFADQWYLRNIGQFGGSANRDICFSNAWNTTRGTSAVVVAIIDDGFQLDHPDLAANIFTNKLEGVPGVDGDGNGYTNDVHGWDFADGDNNPSPVFPDDNHGTAMAGIIAAVADNSTGVAGIASRCRILPVRVDMSGMFESEWVEAITYAAGLADVISISLYIDPSDLIRDAFSRALIKGRGGKGCVICAALGDDGVMRRYSNDSASSPQLITVSSSSNFDRRSHFADYGPSLCLVCPSGGGSSAIYTTDRTGANGYDSGDYAYISGASASCPMGAGVAALMIAANPTWTGLEVRQMLESTCDSVDATANTYNARGWNAQYGHGRVNAGAALSDQRPAWDEYEPDDLASQAAVIEDGELQYRSLSSVSDLDWAKFAVSNYAEVRLTVMGTTNAFLRIYDSLTNGVTNVTRSLTYPELNARLTNGSYFARVETTNGVAVARYGLHFGVLNWKDSHEHDNGTNTAGIILPRTMQYRSLYPTGDVDWAYFNLTTNTRVDINTMGEFGGWLELGLYQGDGTLLTNRWDPWDPVVTNNVKVSISTQLTAGRYYIRVRDHEDVALPSYQILLETYEKDQYEQDDATNQAWTIASGERLSRTLWPTNDVDWFRFVVTNRSAVLIMTDTINPLLSVAGGRIVPDLYNSVGVPIPMDTGNNGSGFKAVHTHLLDPGIYFVRVTGSTSTVVCSDYYLGVDLFDHLTETTSFATATNGFRLEWQGDASFVYQVQYSSNLVSTQAWTTATNLVGRIGLNRWTDDGSSTAPPPDAAARRFYRVGTQ